LIAFPQNVQRDIAGPGPTVCPAQQPTSLSNDPNSFRADESRSQPIVRYGGSNLMNLASTQVLKVLSFGLEPYASSRERRSPSDLPIEEWGTDNV